MRTARVVPSLKNVFS